jgi:hypothetical protein
MKLQARKIFPSRHLCQHRTFLTFEEYLAMKQSVQQPAFLEGKFRGVRDIPR